MGERGGGGEQDALEVGQHRAAQVGEGGVGVDERAGGFQGEQGASKEHQLAREDDAVGRARAEFGQHQPGHRVFSGRVAVPVLDEVGDSAPEVRHVGSGAPFGQVQQLTDRGVVAAVGQRPQHDAHPVALTAVHPPEHAEVEEGDPLPGRTSRLPGWGSAWNSPNSKICRSTARAPV
nr:hypothetical protein [Streptomyces mirabilis]